MRLLSIMFRGTVSSDNLPEDIKLLLDTYLNLDKQHETYTNQAHEILKEQNKYGSTTSMWEKLDKQRFSIYDKQKYLIEQMNTTNTKMKKLGWQYYWGSAKRIT